MDTETEWVRRVRPDELARALAAAGESNPGRARHVLVCGAPGMGKSALLRTVAADLARQGRAGLRAEARGDRPLGLDELLRQLRESSALVPSGPGSGGGAPEDVAASLRRVCETRPAHVSIDDVDRFDHASLCWVADLLAGLRDTRVSVAVSMSLDVSGRTASEFLERASVPVVRVPLRRLTGAQIGRIALDSSGDAGDAAKLGEAVRTGALSAASGGNPLLLDAARLIASAHGPTALTAKGCDRHEEWDGYAAAVEHCLRRLPESARQVAEAMVVLGPDGNCDRLAWLVGRTRPEISHAVAHLRGTGIVAPDADRLAGGPIAAAVERGISGTTLGRSHGRIARVLFDQGDDIEAVAAHLQLSDAGADEWAVGVFRAAARQALSRRDWARAAQHLRFALAQSRGGGADRPAMLTDLACAETVSNPAAGARHLREALNATDDPETWERVVSVYVDGAVRAGQEAQAAEFLDARARRLAATDPDTAALIVAHRVLLEGFGQPLPGEHDARTTSLLGSAFRNPRVARAVRAATAARELRVGTDAARCVAWAREALAEGASGIATTLMASVAYGVLVATREVPSDCPQVLRCAEDARFEGALLARGLLLCQRAERLLADGEVRLARGLAQETLDGVPEGAGDRLRAWPAAVRALAETDLGEVRSAAALVASVKTDASARHQWSWPSLLLARGRIHLAERRCESALTDLEECAALQRGQHWHNPELVPVGVWRPMALAELGRSSQARSEAALFVEEARRWGSAALVGAALRSAGQVGPESSRVALLTEAADVLAGTGARLEWVRARIALGGALHAARRTPEARAVLREAWEAAQEGGALRLADEARDALIATGGRPRRSASHGREALTPGQLRVCLLAGQGATNREIAERLFVSVRTVELHLSAAYRKLSIRGRAQLGQALGGVRGTYR